MWHSILQAIAKALVIPTIFLMGIAGYNTQVLSPSPSAVVQNSPLFGATQPFAGNTYNLAGSGVNGSAATITLTGLTLKQTGQQIVTADLVGTGGTYYVTLEPGSNTKQEIVGCTGVTQSVTTASLTGCTRGLSPIYPYTASTTLQFGHAGGTQVIFSDPPQLFAQYANIASAQTVSGVWTFGSTVPPRYDADPIWANFSTQIFADVAYVNSVVAAGAANASETVKGIVELATGAESAAGTSAGGTGARLALPNSSATSTPYSATPAGSVPTTGSIGGKLSQLWLDLTQAFTFSGQFTTTATTTIAASSVTNDALVLNTVPYQFPSSQGAAGSMLKNNGSGVLSWSSSVPRYTYATTTDIAVSNGFATSTGFVIPASTLTASSTITVLVGGVCASTGASQCTLHIRTSTGAEFVTANFGAPASGRNWTGNTVVTILANNSTSAQVSISSTSGIDTGTSLGTNAPGTAGTIESTSAINTASGFTLMGVLESTNANSTFTLNNMVVIVNP